MGHRWRRSLRGRSGRYVAAAAAPRQLPQRFRQQTNELTNRRTDGNLRHLKLSRRGPKTLYKKIIYKVFGGDLVT